MRWLKDLIKRIRWALVPKRKRMYRVIKSPNMRSIIGFKVKGTPIPLDGAKPDPGNFFIAYKDGNISSEDIKDGRQGFRRFLCLNFFKQGNIYNCQTQYFPIYLKRIK